MRILSVFCLVSASLAFRPLIVPQTTRTGTALHGVSSVSRREWMAAAATIVLTLPHPAQASSHAIQNREGSHTHGSTWFYDDKIEQVREESQMATGGKLDLNNAPVSEYVVFPGMYPHAAGQIASNGPYNAVSDIYKIKTLTNNDIQVLKKYEKEFTVNPPGRMFDERINERVST